MAIAVDTLEIYRGDTYTFSLDVTNYNGSLFDLTDYTLTITIKKKDGTLILTDSFACTTDPTSGVAYGELTSLKTDVDLANNYQYDMQIANTDTPPRVHTIAIGIAKILKDITTT